MNEEERRQHEFDKLIHNKIAKEFQMKARMKAKMRKLHKQESLRGSVTGAGLGTMLNLTLEIPSAEIPPGPITLQRSISETSNVSRATAPLVSSRSINSSNSFDDNSNSVVETMKVSDFVPLKRTMSDVLRDVRNLVLIMHTLDNILSFMKLSLLLFSPQNRSRTKAVKKERQKHLRRVQNSVSLYTEVAV
jgi:hypothetical protein